MSAITFDASSCDCDGELELQSRFVVLDANGLLVSPARISAHIPTKPLTLVYGVADQ